MDRQTSLWLSCIIMSVTAAVAEWNEDEWYLKKKLSTITCLKVCQVYLLKGVPSSRWLAFFGTDSTPKGCWWSLYKRPTDKQTSGAPRWFPLKGIKGCSFSLFWNYGFDNAQYNYNSSWGEIFSLQVFIFGSKNTRKRKSVLALLDFLSETAKLALWKTMKTGNSTCSIHVGGGPWQHGSQSNTRYALVERLLEFMGDTWGINKLLCMVDEENDDLLLNF